ncbi:MAG: 16S rRNA (uracil(1498)-N(3))-methyltransferase [Clostridiales bacterium]|nr:16S rRNA (uracil(1498)-N(3))-methyltransferase [Clostridiales bacterium]
MERFFVKFTVPGESVVLRGDDFAHAARVLRLRAGDAIELCDGAGQVCVGRVQSVEKDSLHAMAGEWQVCESEATHKITLFQCLPKGDKMEWITQKCVELGVCAIVPVLSARCVAQPKEDYGKKRERLQRIAQEAAKQSKRGVLSAVLPLIKLADSDFSAFDAVLLAYEEEKTASLKSALRQCAGQRLALLIGPEGGFTPEEAALLCEKGAISVSLGPRILRTETAGMAMLAQVLYELEG